MRQPWRIYPTLRAMTSWIVIAVGVALAGLVVSRRLLPAEWLRESNDAVGNYLQTLGTIYAVLLAFVVYVVWQQFNDTRGHVESEANELLDLARTVHGLPASVSNPFHAEAVAYVEAVLDVEWKVMARNGDVENGSGDAGAVLEAMWRLLVQYEPCSECHKSLYDEALARFNDVSDRRSQRLSASRLRIPMALRLLLYAGAAMTTASLYLMWVPTFAIHAIITAVLAGAISHVLYVIADLDDCFDGVWQIPRTPFQRVQRYLARCRSGEPLLAECGPPAHGSAGTSRNG